MNQSIIKPYPRENKTTIQVNKTIKEVLTKIGSKGESYNKIITRLISNFEKHNKTSEKALEPIKYKQDTSSKQINISKNITISKYERITISIKDKINPELLHSQLHSYYDTPNITIEVSYNKPINKEDNLYSPDLKIDKIIFDNELYSPKEFLGVLQKDMVYCEEFIYYYLRSLIEVIKIEFKKSNFFFKYYQDYFELAKWRIFFLNSKLSPEILPEVESILSDLKNEKTNKKLIEDVKDSYYNKIKNYGTHKVKVMK